MKAVFISVVIFSLAVYADIARIPRLGGGPCIDEEGNKHELNEDYVNVHNTYCENCTCHEKEIVCISDPQFPVGIHASCEPVFIKEECKFQVVKKDDPTQDCPFPHKIIGQQ
ncbi:beta-microseminoprotein-like [Antedon mediterranea]|uniref:beta-microseminoprotein-like n=1 Tax=Antedon mediterranea TaxID=105859 RepID=UPI003AF4661B